MMKLCVVLTENVEIFLSIHAIPSFAISVFILYFLSKTIYTHRDRVYRYFPLSCPANSFENIYKKKRNVWTFLMEEKPKRNYEENMIQRFLLQLGK